MPAPTRPFRVGDLVNVIASDEALEDISIDAYYAHYLRIEGPHEVERVSEDLDRVYVDAPHGRFWLRPSHLELDLPSEPAIVSRRPPRRVRKAVIAPLPLP